MTDELSPKKITLGVPRKIAVAGLATAAAASLMVATTSLSGSAGAATTTSSFYGPTAKPAVATVFDSAAVDLGVEFTPSVSGEITGIEFFKGARNVGVHTGTLWSGSGAKLATVTFTNETATGWQTANLATPISVAAGQTYTASYHAPKGYYSDQENTFAKGATLAAEGMKAVQGSYHYGTTAAMPVNTWHASSYYVDVNFRHGGPPSSTPVTPPAPPVTTPPAPPTSTPPPPVTTPPAPPVTTPPAPPTSGFPDATNTGPRIASTATLTANSSGPGWKVSGGTLTISGSNVTLRGLTIPFEVDVKGPGAVIEDNIITNQGTGWAIGLYKGNSGTVIGHNILQGPDYSAAHNGGYQLPVATGLEYGIFDATGNYGGTATVEYNNFRYINHPINMTNGIIRENFMHTFSNPNGTQHTDAIFSGGGDKKPLTITHNTMINDRKDATAAVVLLSQAFGQQTNVTVSNNLMAGGGFIIYGAGTPFGSVLGSTNIVVTGNKISTQVYANGGSYGVFNVMPSSGSKGNVTANNVWYDGKNAGKTIS